MLTRDHLLPLRFSCWSRLIFYHEWIPITFHTVEAALGSHRPSHSSDLGTKTTRQIQRARLVQSQVSLGHALGVPLVSSPSYAISYDAERSRNVSHQVRQDGRRLINETYNESWWNKHDKSVVHLSSTKRSISRFQRCAHLRSIGRSGQVA